MGMVKVKKRKSKKSIYQGLSGVLLWREVASSFELWALAVRKCGWMRGGEAIACVIPIHFFLCHRSGQFDFEANLIIEFQPLYMPLSAHLWSHGTFNFAVFWARCCCSPQPALLFCFWCICLLGFSCSASSNKLRLLVLVVQFAAAAVQRVGSGWEPIIDGAFGVSVLCLVTLPPGNHHSKIEVVAVPSIDRSLRTFILGLREYRLTRCNFSMVRQGVRERERDF